MPAIVEKKHLATWLWWRGLAAQAVVALLVAPVFGLGSSASFFGGGLALVLGNSVSALYALRAEAPSGAGAMLGVLGGTVLKWMVVAAVLVLSMSAAGARVPWVLAGLVFAQVAVVVAVLTFKRR
jgi:hypothetical protein